MRFSGRAVGAGTFILAGLLLAGCGQSAPQSSIGLPTAAPLSSAGPSGTVSAGLCADTAQLQQSIAALQQVDLVKQGTGAAKTALQQVQHDLARVADAARTRGAAAAAKVETDIASLQTALATARETPSLATVSSVRTDAKVLVEDARTLTAKLTSGCPA